MHVCMASSTIQTAGNCLNLSMAADHDEEVILHFGSMKLKQDGTIRVPVAASQINVDASPSNSDSFSVFSFKTQEEHAPNPTTFKNIETPCVLAQDNSPTHDDILGPRYFMTGVQGRHPSNMCNPMNYTPSIPSCLPNDQGGSQPFPQARPLDASHLEEILKGGDYEQKESLVSILEDSIFMLMLDRRLHFLYSMLIDACEGQQLDSLVERVLSQGEYFVSAAFCKQGVSSIIKLIRKVKRSPHAFAIARLLSSRFMDIMTHPTARNVIVQCLVLFRSQTNEILYENAIYHFRDLAIHEVGCRSLNDCISLIGGEQRITLLNHIADVSDYLSYDPYGNYVVQNLLSLRNTDITNRITGRLQNQFIRLSMIKGGSHVVEKCMEASDNGILAVVEEILDCPKAPFQLVRDQFGNYIIQTALKKTKEQGLTAFTMLSCDVLSLTVEQFAEPQVEECAEHCGS
ncbi:UNVERIFIED_CONTAM: putative pumilio21 [Sesamum radiatum]|uniref:Pumilio21 n=1 Tax=Sesamum radiatum TaxID=300843 RepID=A0AAW2T2U9_SESRA